MEPAMNPALEAQAIGRIYRLGQRKPVKVIKFVVQNSFESRLVKLLKRKYGHATKPSPSTADKTPENATQDKNESCPDVDVSRADIGHMKNDKVQMMTEEFDAMFGITEPEDIPDQVIKIQHCMTVTRSASSGSLENRDEGSDSCENWSSNEHSEEDDYSHSYGRSYESDENSEGCIIS